MKASAPKKIQPVRQKRGSHSEPPRAVPLDQVRRLNLEADVELQRGHHAAAERLAFRAAQLQGWA